jgi:hypothetical protein
VCMYEHISTLLSYVHEWEYLGGGGGKEKRKKRQTYQNTKLSRTPLDEW